MFLSKGHRDLRFAFQTHPGSQASCRREAKDSALLLSRDGHLLEPTLWPKGSQASCEVWRKDQGLLSRSGRKRSPQSRDDGGFSWAAAPVWGFSWGMTGSSGSLSCGAREVRCPCAWRGGACHCSRVMVGESVLKTRWRRTRIFEIHH